MDNLIAKLYKFSKTIFTNKDLALLWQENVEKNLNAKTAYYVRQKALIRLTRGVFAKSNNYNSKELASSIYKPAYISFETVLREAGVIFQHYETIFVASRYSKVIKIAKYSINFRKLKNIVLFNPSGLINQDNYSIASPERAFLDMIYLFPDYYFDNLSLINFTECAKLVKIYKNKELVKRLNEYRQSINR